VVADPNKHVLGIFSERDISRAISRDGAAALDHAVSKHMTAKVFTVSGDTSVERVMETMTRGRFRHVPVMAEGLLVGIVSIGDVVKHHVNEIESERRALREYITTT
jgi:CBS domain-containing protein